ncbi:hypothetical protein [Timonella senegalensis]|uniref:hypothetical protein n=1 Tax=Timonella senegalensis TaxID=1465825 RepID=UPI0002E1053F|nr:hypothetical protein [Timonella senegalensis]
MTSPLAPRASRRERRADANLTPPVRVLGVRSVPWWSFALAYGLAIALGGAAAGAVFAPEVALWSAVFSTIWVAINLKQRSVTAMYGLLALLALASFASGNASAHPWLIASGAFALVVALRSAPYVKLLLPSTRIETSIALTELGRCGVLGAAVFVLTACAKAFLGSGGPSAGVALALSVSAVVLILGVLAFSLRRGARSRTHEELTR